MPDQFDADALNQLLANYETDESSYFTQHKEARRNGDHASAGEAWRNLVTLREEKARCVNAYNAEVQRANSQPVDYRTQEEKAAAPLRSYADVWEMCKGSKHGVDENAFRAGLEYVRRNPSRGQ
jgi:hypothetical protein